MEVMKIFSSQDDERLYSVLMSEEEMMLFSDGTETAAKVADVAGLGTIVGTGAYVLNKRHKLANEVANKYGSKKVGGLFDVGVIGVKGARSGQGVEAYGKLSKKLGKTGKIGLGVGAGLGLAAMGLHAISKNKQDSKTFSDIPKSKASDRAYQDWKKNKTPENAKKFMEVWTKEVYFPSRQRGIFVDPDQRVVKQAFEGEKTKKYSLSSRLKASKKVYNDGVEYYGGDKYKKEILETIRAIKSNPSEKFYKSESAKKAARKSDLKDIEWYENTLKKNPKKQALRDAWHAFKSPYWEDKLYSFGAFGKLVTIGNDLDINEKQKDLELAKLRKDLRTGKVGLKGFVKGGWKSNVDMVRRNLDAARGKSR